MSRSDKGERGKGNEDCTYSLRAFAARTRTGFPPEFLIQGLSGNACFRGNRTVKFSWKLPGTRCNDTFVWEGVSANEGGNRGSRG